MAPKSVTNPMFMEGDEDIEQNQPSRPNPLCNDDDVENKQSAKPSRSGYQILLAAVAFIAIGIVLVVGSDGTTATQESNEVEDGETATSEFTGIPIAVAHGMGDSCLSPFSRNMVNVIQDTYPDSYVACIMIGATYDEDTLNNFVMTMNDQVDYFTNEIQKDPAFTDGFRFIGISQGNLLIRGYIQKYAHLDNYPSVSSWISVHGPITGVTAFPGCEASDPSGFYCEFTDGLSEDLAYTFFMQRNLAQANYFRDPMRLEDYYKTNFLPVLNNENGEINEGVVGLEGLDQLVLVKALGDTIVYPVESEWFGYFKDGSYEEIETFEETKFYKDDLFGLKTLADQNKVFFESTPGGHIAYNNAYLVWLITTYWE